MKGCWKLGSGIILLILVTACSSLSNKKPSLINPVPEATAKNENCQKLFENDLLSMSYPETWRTIEEVFGRPLAQGKDKEFAADNLITVTNNKPSSFGDKYTAWCTLMKKEPVSADSIQKEMEKVYTFLKNDQKSEVSEKDISINGESAVEKIYLRPRGEPWYKVRDVWIPRADRMIILSCYSYPDSYDQNYSIFQQILESIRIK